MKHGISKLIIILVVLCLCIILSIMFIIMQIATTHEQMLRTVLSISPSFLLVIIVSTILLAYLYIAI